MKWHPDHFTCEICGISLAGGNFVKKDSKPYCKTCHLALQTAGKKRVSCHSWANFDKIIISLAIL